MNTGDGVEIYDDVEMQMQGFSGASSKLNSHLAPRLLSFDIQCHIGPIGVPFQPTAKLIVQDHLDHLYHSYIAGPISQVWTKPINRYCKTVSINRHSRDPALPPASRDGLPTTQRSREAANKRSVS